MMPGGELSDEEVATIFLRVWSHVLVDHIADRGMAETCESLQDLYEYYRPVAMRPLLAPAPQVVRGILPSAQERPFLISAE